MTNPTSGPISFGDINTDFGYSSTSPIFIANTPFAEGANGSPNGPTFMNGFYFTQSGTEQNKLVAQSYYSIAMSADGSTLVVQTSYTTYNIYIRSGNSWALQYNGLQPYTPTTQESNFLLSLSANGNTLAIGVPGYNSDQGAFYIYTRSGTTWTLQVGPYTESLSGSSGFFGTSVSLSGDGNTLAVSATGYSSNQGAFFVYTRVGTTWSLQSGPFVGSGGSAVAYQGGTISISADASTIVCVTPQDGPSTNIGSAWIWGSTGSSWSQIGSRIVDGLTNSRFGCCCAVSANGSTIAVASSNYYTPGFAQLDVGAVYIYNRSGTLVQGPIYPSLTSNSYFGLFVYLSADGNSFFAAQLEYPAGNGGANGAMFIYSRVNPSSSFNLLAGPLQPSDSIGSSPSFAGQGATVSGNGNVLVVPAIGDNYPAGAIYTYS